MSDLCELYALNTINIFVQLNEIELFFSLWNIKLDSM